jgi:hypothetical protein
MKALRIILLGLAGLLFLSPCAWADEEVANRPQLVSSEYGGCYARSVPEESHGQKGTTTVFRVERRPPDTLLDQYDWYSQQIYIECAVGGEREPAGVSVVRLGPWARGYLANPDDLAIAFYLNGRLLRRYSTLDIAGKPENVFSSKSHYVVFTEISGYRRIDSDRYAFDVTTTDGRAIAFDAATGGRMDPP